ncbi:unnamed protein product [Meloidogyne enterolobii]|uniref:Uncharacterized protein n=1 Tax=Meloidogyne enterolobii TaxID=390850 RepID=A0ACB1B2V8_MELEN
MLAFGCNLYIKRREKAKIRNNFGSLEIKEGSIVRVFNSVWVWNVMAIFGEDDFGGSLERKGLISV